MSEQRIPSRARRASLLALAAGLQAALALPASAQIVPQTSGNPAAANSPAALVQTGSRRSLACDPCLAPTLPEEDARGPASGSRTALGDREESDPIGDALRDLLPGF